MKTADEQDFVAFVEARLSRWRRSAFLMCQDWHTSDDIVSAAVAKLYRNWRRAGQAANPDAYAQRVLSRCWLDECRRPWRRESAQAVIADQPLTPPDRLAERQRLAALLRSLGPRQRAVLVLRFYLDYTVEETAEILGISAGTVKSQSARGLEAARELARSPHEGWGR